MNELLEKAISELNNLESGEKFLVKELFVGYIWNRIPRNERLLLGTLFLNSIRTTPTLNIEVLDKTPANQQKYMKK